MDIFSLRAGSDLYGEPYGELCEPHENARASGVPSPFRVLLSRDSSQLPLACEEALHLGERETSSLVYHSSVDFSRYFLNGELAGRLGLFFLSVKLSSWGWNLKYLLCLVFLQNIPKTQDIIFKEINLYYFWVKMLRK